MTQSVALFVQGEFFPNRECTDIAVNFNAVNVTGLLGKREQYSQRVPEGPLAGQGAAFLVMIVTRVCIRKNI